MFRFFVILFFGFLTSCSQPQETELKTIPIAEIVKNCHNFKGKTVPLKATYKGWHCPKTCPNPGITRSDTCWVDDSGCIYAKALSHLDPIKDEGKQFLLEAKVDITPKGVCYIEIPKLIGK